MKSDMRALTLRHPWPWAICVLGKRIENRSWRPPASLVGRWIAIHGGKVPTDRDDLEEIADEAQDLALRFPGRAPERTPFADVVGFTGLVAVARLAGVATESDDPWFEGPYGWVLDGVFVLPRRIACKGAQGLWEVPIPMIEEIRQQWKEVAR